MNSSKENIPSRSGALWSEDEEQQLLNLLKEGKTIEEIAAIHHRKFKGIETRIKFIAGKFIEKGKSLTEISSLTHLTQEELLSIKSTVSFPKRLPPKTTNKKISPEKRNENLEENLKRVPSEELSCGSSALTKSQNELSKKLENDLLKVETPVNNINSTLSITADGKLVNFDNLETESLKSNKLVINESSLDELLFTSNNQSSIPKEHSTPPNEDAPQGHLHMASRIFSKNSDCNNVTNNSQDKEPSEQLALNREAVSLLRDIKKYLEILTIHMTTSTK